MKGDFARVTYDPTLHYSQVFQQQGRVLLEADWNEQAAIQLQLLRALAVDLVGPCWAAGDGFRILATDSTGKPAPLTDWRLTAGHFYVDGILCVNEAVCTLSAQPGAPTPDYGVGDGKSGFENPKPPYALWLDVWERHLSWVEAPHLVDPALDGVDTCSRAQVVWQVRMLVEEQASASLHTALEAMRRRHDALDPAGQEAQVLAALIQVIEKDGGTLLGQIFAAIGGNADGSQNEPWCELLRQVMGLRQAYACPRLAAQLLPPESDEDPCVIAADARYRGCENQLYRIEIHDGGAATADADAAGNAADQTTATFKWSRENGSVIFPVLECTAPGEPLVDGNATMKATLASLGRDARLGLEVGDRVELLDDDHTLAQRALPLLEVVAIDVPSRIVTLSVPSATPGYLPTVDPDKHALLRRWDQREALNATGLLEVVEGEWIELEDGVQIRFQPGGVYGRGDYWQIPARVAGNGTIDWPQTAGSDGKPVAAMVAARGLHHQAVLGGADADGTYTECCCRLIPLCTQRLRNAGQALKPAMDVSALQPTSIGAVKAAAAGTAAKKAATAKKTARKAKATKATKAAKAGTKRGSSVSKAAAVDAPTKKS